jgi:hypothetical protein
MATTRNQTLTGFSQPVMFRITFIVRQLRRLETAARLPLMRSGISLHWRVDFRGIACQRECLAVFLGVENVNPDASLRSQFR